MDKTMDKSDGSSKECMHKIVQYYASKHKSKEKRGRGVTASRLLPHHPWKEMGCVEGKSWRAGHRMSRPCGSCSACLKIRGKTGGEECGGEGYWFTPPSQLPTRIHLSKAFLSQFAEFFKKINFMEEPVVFFQVPHQILCGPTLSNEIKMIPPKSH